VNRDAPLVLGIETSCDETGIGIVRGTTLLANSIASSTAMVWMSPCPEPVGARSPAYPITTSGCVSSTATR